MVQALIAPLVAGVTGLSAASTAVAVISTGLALAATTAIQYFLAPDPPKAKTGTKLSAQSGGAVPVSIMFGETESAGSLIYAGSWGWPGKAPNSHMVEIHAISDLPVDGMLSTIWIDGQKKTVGSTMIDDNNGNAMGYRVQDYNGAAWVRVISDATAVDPYLDSKFGSVAGRPWQGIGRGRSLLVVTARYVKNDPVGFPSVRPVWRGNAFYDLREDSTNGGSGAHRYGTRSTYEYSSSAGGVSANPPLAIYNVVRGVFRGNGTWLFGGRGWSARRFDNDTIIAAANVADENVAKAGGGTEKRYRLGAEIGVNEEPLDFVDRALAACNGRIVESGGVVKLYCGGIGASVASFTDGDIIVSEEKTGEQLAGYDRTVNTVGGTYVEPDNGGQAKAYKSRSNQDYLDADGEVLIREFSSDVVRSNRQMQRLAKHALQDARRVVTWRLTLGPWARKLEPCDVVSWSSDDHGYTSKKFICGDVVLRPDGLVTVDLREANPNDADWEAADEDAFTVGVYGDIVPDTQPTVVTVTSTSIKDEDDNGRAPAVKLAWSFDENDVDAKYIRWQIQLVKGASRTAPKGDVVSRGRVAFDEAEAIITEGLVMGRHYRIRAKIVPESDRETDWTGWDDSDVEAYFTAGTFSRRVISSDLDEAAPEKVTWPGSNALVQRQLVDEDGRVAQYVYVNFVENADPKDSYQAQIVDGDTTYYKSGDSSPIVFAIEAARTLTVTVRARNWAKVWGESSDERTITTTKRSDAPDRPTGLTAVGKFGKIRWAWDDCPDKDFRDTELWVASNNNFANASMVWRGAANGWTQSDLGNEATRYGWIIHRNRSRNESPKYPASNTAGVSATTVKVAEDDIDGTAPAQVPTGLELVQRTRLDGDGRIALKMRASFNTISNARATYMLRIYDGTDYDYRPSKDGSVLFDVVAGLTYTASVAVVGANGMIGTYSSGVALTANKKSVLPDAPTSLAVTPGHKRNRIRVSKSTETDYKETVLYGSTTNNFSTANEVERFSGTTVVHDGLTNNQTWYYWATHYSRSQNESAKYPASNTAGVSGAARRIAAGDFEAGAIADADTDQTPPATPNAPAVVEMEKDLNGDGAVDMGIKMTVDAVSGAKSYIFKIEEYRSNGSTLIDTYYETSTKRVKRYGPTVAGRWYRVSATAVGFNGAEQPTYSSVTSVQATGKVTGPNAPDITFALGILGGFWVVWEQSVYSKDIAYTQFHVSTGTATPNDADYLDDILCVPVSKTGNNSAKIFYGDAGVSRYIWIRDVNRSGVASAWVRTASQVTTGQVGTSDYGTGTITPAKISNGQDFAFSRVHANDDSAAYSFASDITPCAYLHDTGIVRASRTDNPAGEFQRVNTDGQVLRFYRGTNVSGNISVTPSATSYNTSSDYRLKTDVTPLVSFTLSSVDAEYLPATLCRIMAASPVTYRWVLDYDPSNPLVYGFLAHELQRMFPEAVLGGKDEVEDVGTATVDGAPVHNLTQVEAGERGATGWQKTGDRPVYQSVDHSKLVPSLMASVQELTLLLLEQRAAIAALQAQMAD